MNKKQLIEKCRQILNENNIGAKISNQSDIDFLTSVFEGHTEWEQKKGVGIDHYSTQTTIYKNKCFQINRTDKSKTDISFMHSITNRSPLFSIKLACRNAIRKIIEIFRNENVEYGFSKCPITGEILTQKNTHIDHYELTFDELFNKWIKSQNFEILVSKLNETVDNNLETYFTDQKIIDSFILFHNANTKLRAVSKQANLSILKKQ